MIMITHCILSIFKAACSSLRSKAAQTQPRYHSEIEQGSHCFLLKDSCGQPESTLCGKALARLLYQMDDVSEPHCRLSSNALIIFWITATESNSFVTHSS